MFTRIIVILIISSVSILAQYTATQGNLIRIPIDATQIDPADTMGNWINYWDPYESINSHYMDVIKTIQNTYFAKYEEHDYVNTGLTTLLSLENFDSATSNSFGWWMGYYDVPEPYVIYKTIPFIVENGTWLMNGVYNMSFISDNDDITILPWDQHLVYISGKIIDKYLSVFRKDTIEPAYDFYLLDLSNSPDFDTTNAQKIYFDIPVAPYKMRKLSDSLYLVKADSLPYGPSNLSLFRLEGDTFHFIKEFFNYWGNDWEYGEGSLLLYTNNQLLKYQYNPADTSFIDMRVLISGGGIYFSSDFSLSAQITGGSLLIYDNTAEQEINSIDISSLWNPKYPVLDSPYVYVHQTTLVTGIEEQLLQPLSYDLQVYPNPFNPATNVLYTLPHRSRVEIKLIDLLGREVRDIYSGDAEAGSHSILLNAGDLASGIYFISLRSGDYFKVQKILLLK